MRWVLRHILPEITAWKYDSGSVRHCKIDAIRDGAAATEWTTKQKQYFNITQATN